MTLQNYSISLALGPCQPQARKRRVVPPSNTRPSRRTSTMKIVNASQPYRAPISHEENLRREVARLRHETGVDPADLSWTPLTIENQHQLLQKYIEDGALETERMRLAREKALDEDFYDNAAFSCFGLLPMELRLAIWELAFAGHCAPRVHCVMEFRGQFQSNQTIHPLLSVCHESRTHYLANTNVSVAFNNYINLNIDTIYFPTPLMQYVHADTAGYFPADEMQQTWPRFLRTSDVPKIQKLALGNVHFAFLEGRHGGVSSILYPQLRLAIPSLKEFTLVFDDMRGYSICQYVSLTLKPITARVKRRNKRMRGVVGRGWKHIRGLESMIANQDWGAAEKLEEIQVRVAVLDNFEEWSPVDWPGMDAHVVTPPVGGLAW
jgi:hypothetical protein